MTGLWGKEGAELDKRGERLRGRAFSGGLTRSHAGSPGVWGDEGDHPRGLQLGLSGQLQPQEGSRSSGAPNNP